MFLQDSNARKLKDFFELVTQYRAVSGGTIDEDTWNRFARDCEIEPPRFPPPRSNNGGVIPLG